jgi:hypothetical protein
MTDEDLGVEPPEADELFDEEQTDEQEERVTAAFEQAQQYHAVFDAAKEWSRETAADLRVEAALESDENSAAEIEQVAALVRTVTERIEQGDNARSRTPSL